MKFIVSLFLTSLLIFACGLYLPWWSLAIASFVVALCIPVKPGYAFLAGFSGLVLCWSVVAIIRNSVNNGILSEKVAGMFSLGGSSFLLILIGCFTGGLVAGCAALSASLLVNKKKYDRT